MKERLQVGDIIGNTVQGFNFEILAIDAVRLKIKHTKTGALMIVYNYGGMYKPKH
jgi:hypothetical protein